MGRALYSKRQARLVEGNLVGQMIIAIAMLGSRSARPHSPRDGDSRANQDERGSALSPPQARSVGMPIRVSGDSLFVYNVAKLNSGWVVDDLRPGMPAFLAPE